MSVKKYGYCRRHYKRFLAHGDPLGGQPVRRGAVRDYLAANLALAAAHPGPECLLWPFPPTASGYAQARSGDRTRGVHVMACEARHGPAPEPGMEATHACRNRHCWSGAHLSWQRPAGNAADRIRDGTNQFGTASPHAKLTDDQVRYIRSSPKGQRVLAAELGVSKTLIQRIRRRMAWKHLP